MDKERLLFNQNGQWRLVKTNPNTPYSYASLYALNLKDPKGRYTNDDLKRMQDKAIENNIDKVRSMVNLETGKEEPHLLVHYGSQFYDPDHKHPKDINGIKLNDNNNVHVHTGNGALTSTNATYSGGFAGMYGGLNNKIPGNAESKLFSFWVPKSKIHADGSHTGGDASGYHRLSPQAQKNIGLNLQSTNPATCRFLIIML